MKLRKISVPIQDELYVGLKKYCAENGMLFKFSLNKCILEFLENHSKCNDNLIDKQLQDRATFYCKINHKANWHMVYERLKSHGLDDLGTEEGIVEEAARREAELENEHR